MTWTCFTIPRRPKNRLDFCGGLRFTHSWNQTNLQIGTARRYFQMMFIQKRPGSSNGHLLHLALQTPSGRLLWLRLSTRPRLWLIQIWRLQLPRSSQRPMLRV